MNSRIRTKIYKNRFRSLPKCIWHEINAFFSAAKIGIFGNKAEKAAVSGRLFESKFMQNEKYAKRLKKIKIHISERGKYKKIKVNNHIYYWPATANLDSLWIVLAEALIPDHPHYYDSDPTLLRSTDRVLDIGACEGAFSLHAAEKVSQVVAIEPSHTMIESIRLAAFDQNLKNIKLVSCLLGSTNGVVGFDENVNAPESSSIIEKNNATEFRECRTLDSFIEEYFPNGIDYIKCDAEGTDFEILKSGINSLLKNKPRISVASYHAEEDFQKIKNLLEEIGYTVTGQGLHYSPVLHKCFPVLLKAF